MTDRSQVHKLEAALADNFEARGPRHHLEQHQVQVERIVADVHHLVEDGFVVAGNRFAALAEDTPVLFPAQAGTNLIEPFQALHDRAVERHAVKGTFGGAAGREHHADAGQAIGSGSGQFHGKRLAGRSKVEGGRLLHIGGSDFHFLKQCENLADKLGIAADRGSVFFPRSTQLAFVIRRSGIGQAGQHTAAAGDHFDKIAVEFAQLGDEPGASLRTGAVAVFKTIAGGAALFAAGGPIRARSPLGTVAVRPFGTLGATGGPFGAFGALRPFGTFLRLVPRVVEISGVAGISGRIAFDGHGGVLVRGLSSRRDMKVP